MFCNSCSANCGFESQGEWYKITYIKGCLFVYLLLCFFLFFFFFFFFMFSFVVFILLLLCFLVYLFFLFLLGHFCLVYL